MSFTTAFGNPVAGFILHLGHPSDSIAINDFNKDYSKKDLSEIKIFQNNNILFEGSKYELFEVLKQNHNASEKLFFKATNFELLREQKLKLLETMKALKEDGKHIDHLFGIVNFIDSFQDHAADVLGYPEKDIFNLNNPDNV